MIVLPTPNLGFPAVVVPDTLAMFFEGFSLWLAAFALLEEFLDHRLADQESDGR